VIISKSNIHHGTDFDLISKVVNVDCILSLYMYYIPFHQQQ
jgi:hypothetical protein